MARKSTDKATYLAPADSTYAPCEIVVVIPVSTEAGPTLTTGHRQRRLVEVHVCETHKVRESWTEVAYHCFTEPEPFWDWIETEVRRGRRIHVYTPHTMETLRLLGWWSRLEVCGSSNDEPPPDPEPAPAPDPAPNLSKAAAAALRRAAQEPVDRKYWLKDITEGATVSIVRYRVNFRSYLWTDFRQYMPASEDEVHQCVYHTRPPAVDDGTEYHLARRRPADRALMWCRFFVRLAQWWVRNDGGPWGPSVASLALSWLRRRLQPKTIVKHKSPEAASLEESAIIGGRRWVWYWGNIGTEDDWSKFADTAPSRSQHGDRPAGMVHHDIRSMYPFILSRLPFPVNLLTMRRRPSPASVADALGHYGVLAKVLIQTDDPIYPRRTEHGIRYATGRFWTTLAGPELAVALRLGHVLEIEFAALYAMGRPFRDACEELLSLRSFYREEHEFAFETFAKSMANAMSGKLAQKTWVWKARPEVAPPHAWGPWLRHRTSPEAWTQCKVLAWNVWERVEKEKAIRPMGACYAYLTSYGRVMMNDIRSVCPYRSVIAQDTDGIWTTPEGAAALYGDGPTDSAHAGDLHETLTTSVGRFFGSQTYWWGPAWVLAGCNVEDVIPLADRIRKREVSASVLSCKSTPEPIVLERTIETYIGREQRHEELDPDGWTIPEHVWFDTPAERLDAMGAADWVN